MSEWVEQVAKVENALSKENGEFDLFALFLREDAPGKWDLLIAAPWAEKDKASALKSVSRGLQEALGKDELLRLSRIVIIEQKNPDLDAFQRAISVEHGVAEVRDKNFFGLPIKHAYVITSRRAGRLPAVHSNK